MIKIYAPMGLGEAKYLPVAKEQTCLVRQGDMYYYYSIGASPFGYGDVESDPLQYFVSKQCQESEIINQASVIVLRALPLKVFEQLRVIDTPEFNLDTAMTPWLRYKDSIANDPALCAKLKPYWQQPTRKLFNSLRLEPVEPQSPLPVIAVPKVNSAKLGGKRKASEQLLSPGKKRIQSVLNEVSFFDDNSDDQSDSSPSSSGLGSVDSGGNFHPANNFSVIACAHARK